MRQENIYLKYTIKSIAPLLKFDFIPMYVRNLSEKMNPKYTDSTKRVKGAKTIIK